MCEAERTVTAGPAVPGYPLLHTPDGRGRHRSTRQTASASPLRRTGHSSSESHRPALSANRSTASRSSSQPSTPLDDIPETLWEHVLRTSPIPETSNPDFSIEEIISTRLSIDEQAILESLAEDKVVTKKGITDIWEDHGNRLKQLTKRLKDLPSGFFTLRGRRRPPASSPTSSPGPHVSEPFLQQPELTTERCVPDLLDAPDSQKPDGEGVLLDYECRPKTTLSCTEELPEISSLILKERDDILKLEERNPPKGEDGYVLTVPPHFKYAPRYRVGEVVPPRRANLNGTDEDRLLHGPRLKKEFGRQLRPRSSMGSVQEIRSLAFGPRRRSHPGMSTPYMRHNTAPGPVRVSRPVSRPGTNSESIFSIGGTMVPATRRVVYMDGPTSSCDITWDDTRQHHLRAPAPYEVLTFSESDKIPPEIEIGGDRPGYNKIVYHNVGRIERKRDAKTPKPPCPLDGQDDTLSGSGKDGLGVYARLKMSSPANSTISLASLQGLTSIQSNEERAAMVKGPVEDDIEPRPRISGLSGRARITKVVVNTWSAIMTGLAAPHNGVY